MLVGGGVAVVAVAVVVVGCGWFACRPPAVLVVHPCAATSPIGLRRGGWAVLFRVWVWMWA